MRMHFVPVASAIFFLVCSLCFGRTHVRVRNKRVVNGHRIPNGMFPMAISLQKNGKHFCGGVRLGDWVVTAAHCVTDISRNEIEIIAGAEDLNNESSVHNATKIIIHKYNPHTSENDVALLKVNFQDVAPESRFFKMPVHLPSKDYKVSGICVVLGYGVSEVKGPLPGVLNGAVVPLVLPRVCRSQLGPHISPPRASGLFCAGGKGKDSCQGDSGSPLLCLQMQGSFSRRRRSFFPFGHIYKPPHQVEATWIVAGLVSYGVGCGYQGFPGVYTSLVFHREWLYKNMFN